MNLPDGRAVAWYDRRANRISVLADERREEILTALRPYLTGTVAIGPPPVPTAEDLLRLSLPPDEDLAPNRPGEAQLGALTYGTTGTRARHRLRQELTVRQRMGDILDTLAESEDWKVLHSLHPIADHLLIGPPGVFCIRTVQGRRQRVVISDLLLTVGRSDSTPDPREARRAAAYDPRPLHPGDPGPGSRRRNPPGGRPHPPRRPHPHPVNDINLPDERPHHPQTPHHRSPLHQSQRPPNLELAPPGPSNCQARHFQPSGV